MAHPSEFYIDSEGFRPGQFEAAEAIAHSNARVLVVEGPPGSGKSIIALVAAQLRASEGPTNIATLTRQLQRQYGSYNHPMAATVWGRSGYSCRRLGEVESCEDAPCKVELDGSQWDGEQEQCSWVSWGCHYYDAKRRAQQSLIRILNYHYLINTSDYFDGSQQWAHTPRAMLICDESHLAEGAVLSTAEASLSYLRLAELGLPRPPLSRGEEFGEWADIALDKVQEGMRQYEREGDWKGVAKLTKLRRQLELALDPEGKVVESDSRRLLLRPIWGSRYAEGALWVNAQRIVLMSATPGSDWYIEHTLGLRPEERVVTASVFPIAHRPCYIWPVAPISHSSTPEDKSRAFRAIDQVVARYIGKGIVHTNSYRLAEDYVRHTAYPQRVLTHTSQGAAAALRSFLDSGPHQGMVLVSPVVGTGFDCPDLSFQVIAKVPFPDLGDLVVQARKADLPGSYGAMAALNVVQMYGRAVRNETWRGDTWITDSNIIHLLRSQKAMFTRYFTEAVQWVRGGEGE